MAVLNEEAKKKKKIPGTRFNTKALLHIVENYSMDVTALSAPENRAIKHANL